MSRYLYMIGAALLLVTTAIGAARAEFPHRYGWFMHGGPHPFPLAYFAHELDLTDAQQAQIKSLWAGERPTVVPLVRQLVNQCDQMSSANANGAFNEGEARKVADQEAATISQLLVERQRLISRVYADVLTPEQRTKADQLRQRMHGRIEGFLDHLQSSVE